MAALRRDIARFAPRRITGTPAVLLRQYARRIITYTVTPAILKAMVIACRVTLPANSRTMPCRIKKAVAAIRPSEVETRGGGAAAGSSR